MSSGVEFEPSFEGAAQNGGLTPPPLESVAQVGAAEMESYLQEKIQDIPKIVEAFEEAITTGGENLSDKEFAFLAPLLGTLAKVALPAITSVAGPLAKKAISGVVGAVGGGKGPGPSPIPRPGGPVAGTLKLHGKEYIVTQGK